MREARNGTETRILGLLGLARRSGRAVVGARALGDAARSGRLAALVVAGDAGANARRRLPGPMREVTRVELADRARLGAAVGRRAAAAIGLTDPDLAARVVALAGAGGPRSRAGRPPRPGAAGNGGNETDSAPEEGRP